MNVITSYFFSFDSSDFFKKSYPILYLSVIYFFWQHDWSPYAGMAPYLFSPPGLLSGFKLSFPSEGVIVGLQIVGTLAAVAAVFLSRMKALSSFIVFSSLFFLDIFSNGFGFINVQIHLLWFLLIFAVVSAFDKSSWIKSYCFRFLELIIVMAYLQSFLSKMMVSGIAWGVDGTVLQIGVLRQGLPYGSFLADSNSLAKIASILTLIFELSFIVYFFIPSKFKKVLLCTGIFFHLFTFIFLGIGFFHLWLMNLCIVLFAYKQGDTYEHNT